MKKEINVAVTIYKDFPLVTSAAEAEAEFSRIWRFADSVSAIPSDGGGFEVEGEVCTTFSYDFLVETEDDAIEKLKTRFIRRGADDCDVTITD